MNELLVAVDGTDGGRSAAEEALALAREVGASVTFVYVRPSAPRVLGAPFFQNVLSTDIHHARSVGAQALALASARGIEAELEILEGVSGAVARHANRPVLVAKQTPGRHSAVA